MTRHTSRARFLVGFLGVVAMSGAMALALASPAHGTYSHGNSGCTGQEDPIDFLITIPNQILVRDAWNSTTNQNLGPAHGAAGIAAAYWYGGSGSNKSWYPFSSTNGGCLNQTDWATNSPWYGSGWHIRFWQGSQALTNPAAYGEAWGAAHHDFFCTSWSYWGHSSDDYATAAYRQAQDFVKYHDSSINTYSPPYFSWVAKQQRAATDPVHCGRKAIDDGLTYFVSQLTPKVVTYAAGIQPVP